jgi:DNA-binding beta-propeller fold protein YncE
MFSYPSPWRNRARLIRRLLPGIAVAALSLLAACGSGGGGSSSPAATTVAAPTVADPTLPVVTAPANVTAGVSGLTASVPTQTGSSYAWTVTGATITAGGASNQITFTVTGAAGSLIQFSCVVTNSVGVASAAGTASSAIVAAPTAPPSGAFQPSYPSSGPSGRALTLSATFTGATATVSDPVDGTLGPLTSGVPFAITPTVSTTYTLTLTNPAGTSVSAKTRVVYGSLASYEGVASGIGNLNATGNDARFNTPHGAAFDSLGNLYVADSGNNVIRMITPAGVVTTLAGTFGVAGESDGTSASATFWSPTAVAVDGSNNVYVADAGLGRIREISGGTVTTLAYGFTYPSGIAVDTGGTTVYVADSSAGTVSTIPVSAGAGGTVAVLATGLASPSGLALNAGATTLYVAEATVTSNDIVALAIASGPFAAPYTAYASGFSSPAGLAVDAAGNVYVADSGSNTIELVTPSTAPGFTPLAGPGVDGSGSLDLVGPLAEFRTPTGVALDASGNVWVTDQNNNTIREIPIVAGTPPTTTAATSTFAGLAGSPGKTNSPALFNNPTGMAVDVSGNIYVADNGNYLVREISSTGAVSTLAGQGTLATFANPNGVAVDAATPANVYVADTGDNKIWKIASDGSTAADLTPLVSYASPSGIAVDLAGNVYVADTGNNAIRRITVANGTTTVTTIAGTLGIPGFTGDAGAATSATLSGPMAVAVDNSSLATSGTVYVADTANNAIRAFTVGGNITTLAGSVSGVAGFVDGVGTLASFNQPNGLAVDPATGNVYVADTYNQVIRMIVPSTGVVTTLVGVGISTLPLAASGTGSIIVPGALPAGLAFPWAIAVDPLLTLSGTNPAGSLLISVNDAILTSPF